MTQWKRIRWDSIVVTLVDYNLKNSVPNHVVPIHFSFDEKVDQISDIPERRSPEEFQAYIRELLIDHSPNYDYHWYLSKLRYKS
jgi:hypothetical protein